MKDVTTLGFDADDTLWHNERHFKLTEARFAELLADYTEHEHLLQRLVEAERRNVGHYGYGIKGFTLSMVETAIEVTDGRVPADVIAKILEVGRDLLAHPVETFPGVAETLERLRDDFRLLVITKGDLFDQERKLAASGIDHYFHAVEIVSEKTPNTYERVFAQHGDGAAKSAMIGNSVKSDILPALEVGSWAVHIPYEVTWALEEADLPHTATRLKKAAKIVELPKLLGLD